MRATFCTNMSEYLERSEIASLVGHASDLITSEVYIKPEDSVVMNKISKAVDILDNGGVNSDYFDKESNVHTKPNLKNSSLQKAFSENRDQIIEFTTINKNKLYTGMCEEKYLSLKLNSMEKGKKHKNTELDNEVRLLKLDNANFKNQIIGLKNVIERLENGEKSDIDIDKVF